MRKYKNRLNQSTNVGRFRDGKCIKIDDNGWKIGCGKCLFANLFTRAHSKCAENMNLEKWTETNIVAFCRYCCIILVFIFRPFCIHMQIAESIKSLMSRICPIV